MTTNEQSSLLIWCGALHDISEKSREVITSVQITIIQLKIEELVAKSQSKKLDNE